MVGCEQSIHMTTRLLSVSRSRVDDLRFRAQGGSSQSSNSADSVSGSASDSASSAPVSGTVYWRLPPAGDAMITLAKSVDFALRKYRHLYPEFNRDRSGKSDEELSRSFLMRFFPQDLSHDLVCCISNINNRPGDDSPDRQYDYYCIRIPGHTSFPELPENVALCLVGTRKRDTDSPFLQIRRASITFGQSEPAPYELMAKVKFHLLGGSEFPPDDRPGTRSGNVLNLRQVTSLEPFALKNAARFKGWSDFLDFKDNLVKHKAQGLRYLLWSYDRHSGCILFYVVAPDRFSMDRAISTMKREVVHAYKIEVSSDSMIFSLQLGKDNNNSLSSAFSQMGQIVPGGVTVLDLRRGSSRGGNDFANPDDIAHARAMLLDIVKEGRTSLNPDRAVMALIKVQPSEDLENELSKIDFDYVPREEKGDGKARSVDPRDPSVLLRKAFKGMPRQGFISISLLGDLALINRHREALRNLYSNDSCYAPHLSGYLFDITSALEPESIEEIDTWYNDSLNEAQKLAVRKMISAPNICLVQGPPGTGKTTVIAEACMQLAGRGNRVLLASQSHDALDNALSRLQSNPQLKVIRLARFSERITDEGKSFTESAVLGRQYQAIADDLNGRCLGRLTQLQNTASGLKEWTEEFDFLLSSIASVRSDLEAVSAMRQSQERLLTVSDDVLREQQIIDGRINALETLQNFFKAVQQICIASESPDVLQLRDALRENSSIDVVLANITWPDDEKLMAAGEAFMRLEQLLPEVGAFADDYLDHHDRRGAIIASVCRMWHQLNLDLSSMKMDLENTGTQRSSVSAQNKAELESIKRQISLLKEQLGASDEIDNSMLDELRRLNGRRTALTLGSNAAGAGLASVCGDYSERFPDFIQVRDIGDEGQLRFWLKDRSSMIVNFNRTLNRAMARGIEAAANMELELLSKSEALDESLSTARRAKQELELINAEYKETEERLEKWLDTQYQHEASLRDIYLGLPELASQLEAKNEAAVSSNGDASSKGAASRKGSASRKGAASGQDAATSTDLAVPELTRTVLTSLARQSNRHVRRAADERASEDGLAALSAADVGTGDALSGQAGVAGGAAAEVLDDRSVSSGGALVLRRGGRRWRLDDADLARLLEEQKKMQAMVQEQLVSFEKSNGQMLPLYRKMAEILKNPEERATKEWKLMKDTYLASCNVVAMSCNESEKTLVNNKFDGFDVVIIDEVSKATPLEMLLPLMRAPRAILVGDHRQLPPIFNESDGVSLSEHVEQSVDDYGFDHDARQAAQDTTSPAALTQQNLERYQDMVTASLFKELFEKCPDTLRQRLNIQFRMHPAIMQLINRFYDDALICGNPEQPREHGLSFTTPSGTRLMSEKDHVLWVDTTLNEKGASFQISKERNVNEVEARLIARTLVDIDRQCSLKGYSRDNRLKVGVVSFYQPQCRVIRSEISKLLGRNNNLFSCIDVEINTVIRYQGKEKPVIILSLVKNNGGPMDQKFGSGRANIARFEFINVAMSRAQNLLMVFGARNMLQNRSVRLPRMDSTGYDDRMVYKNMFDYLEFTAKDGSITTTREFLMTLPDDEAIRSQSMASASGRGSVKSKGRGAQLRAGNSSGSAGPKVFRNGQAADGITVNHDAADDQAGTQDKDGE